MATRWIIVLTDANSLAWDSDVFGSGVTLPTTGLPSSVSSASWHLHNWYVGQVASWAGTTDYATLASLWSAHDAIYGGTGRVVPTQAQFGRAWHGAGGIDRAWEVTSSTWANATEVISSGGYKFKGWIDQFISRMFSRASGTSELGAVPRMAIGSLDDTATDIVCYGPASSSTLGSLSYFGGSGADLPLVACEGLTVKWVSNDVAAAEARVANMLAYYAAANWSAWEDEANPYWRDISDAARTYLESVL